MPRVALRPDQRFICKVDMRAGREACWPWMGSTFRDRGGYGKFQAGTSRVTSATVYAHRYMKELVTGEAIPGGMDVMHSCDNPICCNPRHLTVGTRAANLAGMVHRGRYGTPRRRRLTAADAAAIRQRAKAGEARNDLAAAYGVSHQSICNVLAGRTHAP